MPNVNPTQLQGITDLTVLAEIKTGLIEGIFDSRSYLWRLQRMLDLLDAARRGVREADVMPNLFADGVARFRGIQFFRFAIVTGSKPVIVADNKLETVPDNKLLLNVTFDGGWEPYIRLIWGQLGTMLDLIFCHCKGYPLAATSSFDDYCRWVRGHEWASQFFYADSGGTVADRVYLNRLEALQRAAGGRPGADLSAARLALDSPPPPQPSRRAALIALRTLKGLFSLVPFFGMPDSRDGLVLLRFAQDFLPDLRAWFAQGLFDPGRQFDDLGKLFEREKGWLMSPQWRRPNRRDRLELEKSRLQAGILDSPRRPADRFARGALVLARVVKPDKTGGAREWLRKSSSTGLISDGDTMDLLDDRVLCTVAITYPGLQALGVHEDHLASLPAEFAQGMEARAGVLGDLRINHFEQWNRPRAWSNPDLQPAPIDLSLVHLVIQLRTCEAGYEETDDRSKLLARLQEWITENLPSSGPIEVLAVEPIWSRPTAAGEAAPRDHFGYVDGVSQPVLTPSGSNVFWDDAVKTGELLLGWVNDRGDGPLDRPGGDPEPVLPKWLEFGTFLVVRKIRQYVERFDAVVERAAGALVGAGSASSPDKARELVRAKLMGRCTDGTPLVEQRGSGPNDFDFRSDADGAQCPFASHVRRANPRTPMAGMRPPRIARRGMSYGHGSERGVLFMAYNASIAEQFEVIQRWLTGGNSSSVPSAQSDPLLGVPQLGEPAIFRFTHGDEVIRVDLGNQAICKLEWGLYAFVPSMDLLENLGDLAEAAAPPKTETPAPPVKEEAEETLKKRVKLEFEDDVSRGERWNRLREQSGIEKIGRTVIVGSLDLVKKVLKDHGSTYSVLGYGKRMEETLGPSPFGEDDAVPKVGHKREFVGVVKKAIGDSVTEESAYETAFQSVSRGLTSRLAGARALGMPAASVDVIDLGIDLIADLCQKWFGAVYGDGVTERGGLDPNAQRTRCPGHFLAMARNVFSAHPNKTVQELAARQAPDLKKSVAEWVDGVDRAAKLPPAPVLGAVLDSIDSLEKNMSREERDGTAANVMLGLPAPLLGSWVKVLRAWVGDRRLWQLQYELSLRRPRPVDPEHPDAVRMDRAVASGALHDSLILTMAADPVADGIWRTAKQRHKLDGVDVHENDIVWLGLGAALADAPGNVEQARDLLFGGVESGAPHACPGRGLAIGALLGALTALLLAGQWAPTASPTTLRLTPLLP